MKNTHLTQALSRLLLCMFAVAALSVHAEKAHAAYSPLSVNLLPPVGFPGDSYSVTGLRISALWGRQRDLYGIDLGVLGNITDQTFVGSALSGVFNLTKNTTTVVGVQLAGITNININKTSVYGVQLAGLVNSNSAESSVTGLQAALIANLSAHTNIYGLQLGLYNVAQEVYGLQIGLVNMASNLHGLQIGLVNFNDKGLFAVSPILNVGF